MLANPSPTLPITLKSSGTDTHLSLSVKQQSISHSADMLTKPSPSLPITLKSSGTDTHLSLSVKQQSINHSADMLTKPSPTLPITLKSSGTDTHLLLSLKQQSIHQSLRRHVNKPIQSPGNPAELTPTCPSLFPAPVAEATAVSSCRRTKPTRDASLGQWARLAVPVSGISNL